MGAEENTEIKCENGTEEDKTKGVEELKNGDDSISSVSESSDETPKRKAGRPKKPMVDVNNILDKIPPQPSPYPKRSSSTPLRSSTSTPTSETSKTNSSETEESSGRPKRSRKTVDKDL